ncbi:hypothetical protein RB195_011506 [Necator americanus]|uniref:Uncharacterized protein n=1 Tax=Necator americanus TaxID=51031 RepID=A0ABR1D2Q0_NECAM
MGIAQWRDSCEDRPHTYQPEDSLSQGDRHNGENHVNYEMLLRGLRACAERATKELLERRNTLRLDTNASHIERKRKILEAAQRRTSLQKCHRDLREYNIPLAFFLSEDGTRTSSCHEMEIITNILDGNGEGTKRVEEMLRIPRPVKTGHLSKGKRTHEEILRYKPLYNYCEAATRKCSICKSLISGRSKDMWDLS